MQWKELKKKIAVEEKPNPLRQNTVIRDKRMRTVTQGVKKRKMEGLRVELYSRKKCSM